MINIRGLLVSLLVVSPFHSSLGPDFDLDGSHRRLIHKTKGRSLEEMDVIFGAVQEDKRRADIEKQERGTLTIYDVFLGSAAHLILFLAVLGHDVPGSPSSERSVDQKV